MSLRPFPPPTHPPNHQVLESELGKCKDDLSALEEEAEDMRDKLKKMAKQEKHEKGHTAMTEELKKMEEETGISVRDRPRSPSTS